MDRLAGASRLSPWTRAGHGLVRVAGVLAGAVAALAATVLAVVFTATVVVIALIGVVLVAFAGLAVQARRKSAGGGDGGAVIEARHVGGHSWVAYGWDSRR